MPILSLGRLALAFTKLASPENRKSVKLYGLRKRNAKRARIASLDAAIKTEKRKGRRS